MVLDVNGHVLTLAKAAAEKEIERLLAASARYVLVSSGVEFMAIRTDGAFISAIAESELFLSDVDPSLRARALDELMSKSAAQPEHIAVILAIY